jgi:hypothetical protein
MNTSTHSQQRLRNSLHIARSLSGKNHLQLLLDPEEATGTEVHQRSTLTLSSSSSVECEVVRLKKLEVVVTAEQSHSIAGEVDVNRPSIVDFTRNGGGQRDFRVEGEEAGGEGVVVEGSAGGHRGSTGVSNGVVDHGVADVGEVGEELHLGVMA